MKYLLTTLTAAFLVSVIAINGNEVSGNETLPSLHIQSETGPSNKIEGLYSSLKEINDQIQALKDRRIWLHNEAFNIGFTDIAAESTSISHELKRLELKKSKLTDELITSVQIARNS